ncbi:PREDICTED: acetylcholine receptor subunit alpha-type acr-16-like, partial [Priapulus caudatus]|uniref:Acetylcholine receptor subunit alpha-type acr-16-like n=1 Tax=Priapulus caudatus TaxID=37621 RepID=A0ABM1ED63_PRICU
VRKILLEWLPRLLRMSRPIDRAHAKQLMINAKLRELELKERCSRSLLANVLDIDDDFKVGNNSSSSSLGNSCSRAAPTSGGGGYDADNNLHGVPGGGGGVGGSGGGGTRSELTYILREMRYITDYMRQDDSNRLLSNDWKFAAMVVDRICLWLFTIYTAVSSIAVVSHAPNLFS